MRLEAFLLVLHVGVKLGCRFIILPSTDSFKQSCSAHMVISKLVLIMYYVVNQYVVVVQSKDGCLC